MDIVQPNRPKALRRSRVALMAFALLAAWLIAVFSGLAAKAKADAASPAVLILDQSAGLSAYQEIIDELRTTVLAQAKTPPVFYTETLDLSRFTSVDHSRTLDVYLRSKFRNVSIDII